MSKIEIQSINYHKIYYWCPTCKVLHTIEVDSPVICGRPICAKCNGQVWRKSDEWVENEKRVGRIKDGQ